MPVTKSVPNAPRDQGANWVFKLVQAASQRIDGGPRTRIVGGLELGRPSVLASNPAQAIEERLRRLGHTAEDARSVASRCSIGGAGLEGWSPTSGRLLEQVLGRNALMPVGYLEAGARAARSVARVHVRGLSKRLQGYGTGFLVAPRLFLTNHHVLPDATTARSSLVEFDYQRDAAGDIAATSTFECDPRAFFVTSPVDGLDFTLVALKPRAKLGGDPESFAFLPLTAIRAEVLAGECVSIIQHPLGEPKQVALRENEVLRLPGAEESFLHYQTDTQPGSSGAPVFNDSWEVIALHHAGKPAVDAQGRVLANDGRVWTPEMGIDRIRWVANEGVRVWAIVTHLQRLPLKRAARALLAPAFQPGAAMTAAE